MNKLLLSLVMVCSITNASEFLPTHEMRYPGGLRVQISDQEAWCKGGQRAAKMFDGDEVRTGCWWMDSSGSVVTISWPNEITHHPFWKFTSLKV